MPSTPFARKAHPRPGASTAACTVQSASASLYRRKGHRGQGTPRVMSAAGFALPQTSLSRSFVPRARARTRANAHIQSTRRRAETVAEGGRRGREAAPVCQATHRASVSCAGGAAAHAGPSHTFSCQYLCAVEAWARSPRRRLRACARCWERAAPGVTSAAAKVATATGVQRRTTLRRGRAPVLGVVALSGAFHHAHEGAGCSEAGARRPRHLPPPTRRKRCDHVLPQNCLRWRRASRLRHVSSTLCATFSRVLKLSQAPAFRSQSHRGARPDAVTSCAVVAPASAPCAQFRDRDQRRVML